MRSMICFGKSGIDPHTNYYDLESAQKFSESLEGSNVGLGMSYFLDEDQNFVVKDVFLDSPAEKAGLQTGDVITTIDGQACSQIMKAHR